MNAFFIGLSERSSEEKMKIASFEIFSISKTGDLTVLKLDYFFQRCSISSNVLFFVSGTIFHTNTSESTLIIP